MPRDFRGLNNQFYSAVATAVSLGYLLFQEATRDEVTLSINSWFTKSRISLRSSRLRLLHPVVDAPALEHIDLRSVSAIYDALGSQRSRGFFAMRG